ncbi:N-terminal C2 in EEIG1 and EHBP1 proteins-domain-containing protein [Diplogelasinospora grovesii]|uniref:N-terminal C2 in EEIG1 and EHBP1 proteins-domain-containing protein n=1 Tax=Diplogelasinospora grovesii TaxID=303347 RepID=A0AAN6S7W7_9PEZI|nr:N-terminal C2 in EEIG1 and EHBP1 proteins-domain-containing protein [Diplogelasinospora grovesii]
MASLINKARKPKFDLHLTIYDLNNVPLVSGVSLIKWYLPHSIHGEHRGRTPKCPIANHRVEYSYSKLVPVRIAIDKNNNLSECVIEFEVLQEFGLPGAGGVVSGRDEKITLGVVRLNLSEYVEESEAILRDGGSGATAFRASFGSPGPGDKQSGAHHSRKRSSLSDIVNLPGGGGLGGGAGGADISPRSTRASKMEEESAATTTATDVEEGVVRRYLMQDSKINSTLKIGILMVQVDGERNFIAPPLKTAPVFGGIAGIMAGDMLDGPGVSDSGADATAAGAGQLGPSVLNKSRDTAELQDMYRRALAASWACHPGDLPADECIEDIFAGGDGFRRTSLSPTQHHHGSRSSAAGRGGGEAEQQETATPSTGGSAGGGGGGGVRHHNNRHHLPREDSGSASGDEDMMGTLRPRDMARFRHHMRNHSGASDRSIGTVVREREREQREQREREQDRDQDRQSSRGVGLGVSHGPLRDPFQSHHNNDQHHRHRRDGSKGSGGDGGLRSRSESMASLATTHGSDARGRDGFKRAREVDEFEVRDDLCAWSVRHSRF